MNATLHVPMSLSFTISATQVPDAHDRRGNLVGMVVGAHYRTKAIAQEELLLHCVQVSANTAVLTATWQSLVKCWVL